MKIKVVIPESLKDIKAADYARFVQMDIKEQDLVQQAILYFVGLNEKDLRKISAAAITEIGQSTMEALNEIPKLERFVELDGVKYGFHPDLEKMTFGEFVDLEEYFKEPYKNWQRILGLLYRPVVKESQGRYLIEDYDPDKHNGDALKEVDAAVLQGALLFFYRLEIALVKDLLTSLEKKGEIPPQAQQQSEKDLGRSGGGMRQLTHLLGEIYSKWKPSQK